MELYAAFSMMSAGRQSGMGGMSPIPLSEILAYMDSMGIRGLDTKECWIMMVRALDAVYLKYVADKRTQSAPKVKNANR